MTIMIKWLPYMIYTLVVAFGTIMVAGQRRRFGQRVTLLTFGVYMIVVGFLTLTPTSYAFGVIATMDPVWVGNVPTNPFPLRGVTLDFYLNVLMTVPMGVYLGLFKKWRPSQILIAGLVMGSAIESTQFVLDFVVHLSRWVDINDVLTNAAGVIVGYGLVMLLKHSPLKRLVQFFALNWVSKPQVEHAKQGI